MITSLKPEDLKSLAEIVRAETGNEIAEKNFAMLESRMRVYLMKLGIDSMGDYWSYFKKHEEKERQSLRGLMTTHYTFFFREFAHFEVLQKWIEEEGDRLRKRYQQSASPVRIWSAACSMGQEAYSIAMFLEIHLVEKLGVPYEIVGTDIDAGSVAHATNGVYPIKEVNTIPQMYLQSFWRKGTGPIQDFAAVHPNLKQKTRFQVLNLLKIKDWSEKKSFDVIFCRNVFIYFSPENVRQIALDANRRLETNGLFISGMSEPLRFDGWDLAAVGPSAYQKIPVAGAATTPAPATATFTASTSAPKSQPQPIAISAKKDQSQKLTVVPAKYKVLCVDDSTTIQAVMKKIFSQDPLCEKVDVAGNGAEARKKLDQGKYQLITLDIHMPEVSGIEFLEKLYDKKKDPPVIMVSSVNRADKELATKSLQLGAVDYVEKPEMNKLQTSTEEILTKVKLVLKSRPQTSNNNYDTSIGQKIEIRNASQCVRIVLASAKQMSHLGDLVKDLEKESPSPALVIVSPDFGGIEGQIKTWTKRTIHSINGEVKVLNPGQIYLLKPEVFSKISSLTKGNSISLQILDLPTVSLTDLKKASSLQVLVDEVLAAKVVEIQNKTGLVVSEVTPPTSFSSISAEFFVQLRKVAA